jgi:hypothetical protein
MDISIELSSNLFKINDYVNQFRIIRENELKKYGNYYFEKEETQLKFNVISECDFDNNNRIDEEEKYLMDNIDNDKYENSTISVDELCDHPEYYSETIISKIEKKSDRIDDKLFWSTKIIQNKLIKNINLQIKPGNLDFDLLDFLKNAYCEIIVGGQCFYKFDFLLNSVMTYFKNKKNIYYDDKIIIPICITDLLKSKTFCGRLPLFLAYYHMAEFKIYLYDDKINNYSNDLEFFLEVTYENMPYEFINASLVQLIRIDCLQCAEHKYVVDKNDTDFCINRCQFLLFNFKENINLEKIVCNIVECGNKKDKWSIEWSYDENEIIPVSIFGNDYYLVSLVPEIKTKNGLFKLFKSNTIIDHCFGSAYGRIFQTNFEIYGDNVPVEYDIYKIYLNQAIFMNGMVSIMHGS